MEKIARYQIGQQFPHGNRVRRVRDHKAQLPEVMCTITDIHWTYNNAGELLSLRYVAVHEFCGQKVEERDILELTIQRRLNDYTVCV